MEPTLWYLHACLCKIQCQFQRALDVLIVYLECLKIRIIEGVRCRDILVTSAVSPSIHRANQKVFGDLNSGITLES